MKITFTKPCAIDLKELMGLTTQTLNKRIVLAFSALVSKDGVKSLCARAREIRLLIRNDATATVRLIGMAPEKDVVYRSVFSTQANKLMDEMAMLIKQSIGADVSRANGDLGFVPGDVEAFAIPQPPQKQEEKDLHLEPVE